MNDIGWFCSSGSWCVCGTNRRADRVHVVDWRAESIMGDELTTVPIETAGRYDTDGVESS